VPPPGTFAAEANGRVVIVTISREYGAAGLAVAYGTASALGYELLTDDLPATVAARLGTSLEEVAARVQSQPSLSERMISDLGAATPEIFSSGVHAGDDFDEEVRRDIETAIRERADADDVVILGRLASAFLSGRSNLLRVFLTAPREWRVERLIETFGFTREQAARELERTDIERRRLAKDRYKLVWGDPRSYDLVIDTSRFGIDGAVAVIFAAARAAGA
jgi:cytidylate kinase